MKSANYIQYDQLRTWIADAVTGTGMSRPQAGDGLKKLCISDVTGAQTCMTKIQVDELLAAVGTLNTSRAASTSLQSSTQ